MCLISYNLEMVAMHCKICVRVSVKWICSLTLLHFDDVNSMNNLIVVIIDSHHIKFREK